MMRFVIVLLSIFASRLLSEVFSPLVQTDVGVKVSFVNKDGNTTSFQCIAADLDRQSPNSWFEFEGDLAVSITGEGSGKTEFYIPTENEGTTITRVDAVFLHSAPSARLCEGKSILKLENSAFYQNSSIRTVFFPACTHVGDSAFYKCSSLEEAYIPSCTNIVGSFTFVDCTSLEKLVLSNSTMTQVKSMSDFPWSIPSSSCKIICSDGWVDRSGSEHPNQ